MYDPIMCMNIPNSVKTKDAISEELKREIIRNGGTLDKGKYRYDIDMNKNIIRRIDRSLLDTTAANSGWKIIGKFRDSAIDKAIRNCDSNISLVKTIEKKNGYAIHIVEGGHGERVVLTFPGESYSNPHMWLGSNNASNVEKAKEMLNRFTK